MAQTVLIHRTLKAWCYYMKHLTPLRNMFCEKWQRCYTTAAKREHFSVLKVKFCSSKAPANIHWWYPLEVNAPMEMQYIVYTIYQYTVSDYSVSVSVSISTIKYSFNTWSTSAIRLSVILVLLTDWACYKSEFWHRHGHNTLQKSKRSRTCVKAQPRPNSCIS